MANLMTQLVGSAPLAVVVSWFPLKKTNAPHSSLGLIDCFCSSARRLSIVRVLLEMVRDFSLFKCYGRILLHKAMQKT